MKTLVTGAKGYTASHLLPLLDGEVMAYEGDILSPEFLVALSEFVPDRVYHLAAVVPIEEVRRDFTYAMRVNVSGTKVLLDALLRYAPNARVLMVGSCDSYGMQGPVEPVKETAKFNPVNEYGVTKVAQELLARLYCRVLPIVFTRTFNFTGPGQSEQFVCSAFAHQFHNCAVTGTNIVKTGELVVVRDFLDIRDVVRAYVFLMEQGNISVAYNVCSGTGVRLSKILQVLKVLSGVNAVIERDDARVRRNDSLFLVGDNKRLTKLGWERRYSLGETLSDLYKSIKEGK